MDLLKGHDWSPLDRSIDALVGRLRKKIEPDPDHPRLVKTVRGIGYAFTADAQAALAAIQSPAQGARKVHAGIGLAQNFELRGERLARPGRRPRQSRR